MQIHNIKAKTKRKKSVQVGRGGTRGKTSGRGTKGQKARAGRKLRPEMRDIIKKIPKQRGRGKNIFQSFQIKPVVVNLIKLDGIVDVGDVITPTYLVEKGIISRKAGLVPQVKILGTGAISKKMVIEGCFVSAEARSKVEKLGGSVTIPPSKSS